MPSETANAPTLNALAILPLPEFNTLSQNQVRGFTCVFDGVALTPATAVDLGEHKVRQIDTRVSWYPRACRTCTQRQVMQALSEHECTECGDKRLCGAAQALVRLAREARR